MHGRGDRLAQGPKWSIIGDARTMEANGVRLAVYPLLWRLEAESAFHLPEYAGALLRGGFGKYFRELVCVTGAPTCEGCEHRSSCRYSVVFESPIDPERHPVLHGLPYAPHPFVLTPPESPRSILPAGQRFVLRMSLFGSGIDHLPHVISVLDEMGRRGQFGGRFRIVSLADGGGLTVYDGRLRTLLRRPEPWAAPPAGGGPSRLHLEFVTPLRLRTNGRYNASPGFPDVAQALFRRIHFLAALYGEAPSSTAWTHPYLAMADAVRTGQAQFRLFRWDRFSGRQERRVAMDGLMGGMTVTGDLAGLYPYLAMGQHLHVGSGTSMGMGRYMLQIEGTSS